MANSQRTSIRTCPGCGSEFSVRPSSPKRCCSRSCGQAMRAPHTWYGRDPKSRFMDEVEKSPNGCWLWTGSRTADGYGFFSLSAPDKSGRIEQRAHRAAWRLFHGELPSDKLVCHTCDMPLCVNPSHLFLGTKLDNAQDMAAKGRSRCQKKTHCVNGHEYTAANTRYSLMANGRRQRKCRACSKP